MDFLLSLNPSAKKKDHLLFPFCGKREASTVAPDFHIQYAPKPGSCQ
jgi:hypothetical protein